MNNANGGNILFHFKGDSSQLKNTVSSLGGMTKSILAATGITKAFSMAWNMVSSSTGDAIDRFDQLKAFPKTMQSLGISAEASEKAVNELSEGLKGLPTTLNAGTSAVSRFVSKNEDIERSTKMFLAVNDAIIAGNAPMVNQEAALEQLTQAYARGKPELKEWQSLMVAMPGQMKQIAKSMGYVDTNALYDALLDGKVSMDDFMDAIIRLDQEGGDGLESFSKQARNSTGGIKTSMTNMKTAVVRGLTGVIDSIDKGLKKGGIDGGIAGLIGKLTTGIDKGFGTIQKDLEESITGLIDGSISPADIGSKLTDKVSKGLVMAFDSLSTAIPEAIPKVVDFLSGVANGLGENLPELIPAAGKVITTLYDELTKPENIMKMGEAGAKLGTGLVEGIWNYVSSEQGQSNMKKTADQLKWHLAFNGNPIGTEIGRSFLVGLASGIMEKMGVPKEQLEKVKAEMKDFIKNPIKFLWQHGKDLITGFVDGIKAGLLGLNPLGKKMKQEVKSGVGDTSSTLKGSGSDLVRGMINGISGQLPSLRNIGDTLAGMVSSIVAIRNKIHSPSRLMEYYGEMMGQGYINGIEAMKGQLANATMDTFVMSPQMLGTASTNFSPNVIVNNQITNNTDPLGQTVSQIKTFSNGAKQDYNYGMGV